MNSSDIMALIRGDFGRRAPIEGRVYYLNDDDNAGTIRLQGKDYSLDDCNAVNSMSEDIRPTFWSVCSDKAKDSYIYIAYAESQLVKARIKLTGIPKDRHVSILNNASNLVSLKESLKELKIYRRAWFKTLFNPEDSTFDLLLNNIENIILLMKGFVDLGIKNPIDTFKKIKLTYLNVILPNPYNVIPILRALKHEFRYGNYLEIFLLMDIEKLKLLVNDDITSIQIMRGFLGLGVSDPWMKFLSLNDAERACLVNNPQSFLIMKSLKNLRYADPFSVFMRLDTQVRKKLTGPHHDAKFELLELFQRFSNSDPLETFFSLNADVADLLVDRIYAASQIIEALYASGEKSPLTFMLELGKDAIVTMLGSYSEYVSRIMRGDNIKENDFALEEDLFTPPKVPIQAEEIIALGYDDRYCGFKHRTSFMEIDAIKDRQLPTETDEPVFAESSFMP
ncbi:hypothetical protein [Legionella quateirensis]|uniref:Uncharacterized protein n=1 Tax=Legionella quateirensis TaxID=45072 RepID=A0A378KQN8_9GAMM|nr:hypothetical protein [Legionella quateirensis]KTD52984.1 hypothetical protein Lqua_0817 [Legionella quateirensis]STY17204.1 Uncharacterised protein [Legionella quateirensis]